MKAGRAVEMPAHGPGGKPKAGFPPGPQPLEIANDAIPTFPPPRLFAYPRKTNPNPQRILNCVPWESGNRKARFPLSHRTGSLRRKEGECVSVEDAFGTPEQNQKRRPGGSRSAPAFRLILRLENAATSDRTAFGGQRKSRSSDELTDRHDAKTWLELGLTTRAHQDQLKEERSIVSWMAMSFSVQ